MATAQELLAQTQQQLQNQQSFTSPLNVASLLSAVIGGGLNVAGAARGRGAVGQGLLQTSQQLQNIGLAQQENLRKDQERLLTLAQTERQVSSLKPAISQLPDTMSKRFANAQLEGGDVAGASDTIQSALITQERFNQQQVQNEAVKNRQQELAKLNASLKLKPQKSELFLLSIAEGKTPEQAGLDAGFSAKEQEIYAKANEMAKLVPMQPGQGKQVFGFTLPFTSNLELTPEFTVAMQEYQATLNQHRASGGAEPSAQEKLDLLRTLQAKHKTKPAEK
jgi:hypothetical protein